MTPRSRRLRDLLLLGGLSVPLAACVSLLPNTPPAQLYRFGADRTARPEVRAPNARPIVLGSIDFPRAAASDGILTATGDQTAYISGARWVAPARQLFAEALAREFETRAPGFVVVGPGDPAAGRLEIRGDVLAFETDYAQAGAAPTVRLVADVHLFDAGGRALADRVFAQAEPASENRVSAIVSAYDRTVDQVVDQIAAWAAGVAGAPSGPASPPSGATSVPSRPAAPSTEAR